MNDEKKESLRASAAITPTEGCVDRAIECLERAWNFMTNHGGAQDDVEEATIALHEVRKRLREEE